MSNRKYFDTTLVSITFGESLVLSGIDYSVIGSRLSLLENRNNKKFLLTKLKYFLKHKLAIKLSFTQA